MYLKLLNFLNNYKSYIYVFDSIFNRDFNLNLIHQIITSYKFNSRKFISKQKDRSEVNHSTKKPWRQKGTGKARCGMTSSPLWRGGGKVFPNFPIKRKKKKFNKKMYKFCISTIFSQLVREKRLFIIDNFNILNNKTKFFISNFNFLKSNYFLIIINKINKNFLLSCRNLLNIKIINYKLINPIILIFYKNILISKDSLKYIQKDLIKI